jgi:signal transduction histidine kinase
MAERAALARVRAKPWFDPLLAIALTAACLVEVLVNRGPAGSSQAAILVILLGAPVAVRRRYPLAAALAQAAVMLAVPLLEPKLRNAEPVLASVLLTPAVCYSCGAHASRRRGLLGVAALAVALQVSMGFADFPNVEILFFTVGPWWVGRQVRLRQQLVSELAERTAELEAEQDVFVRLSVRRERARIAHELHDIVAHHLAVIVVQAGAGRMTRVDRADLTLERFSSIRQSAEQALAEMARLVDVLHADSHGAVEGLRRLLVLLEEASAGGLDVRLAQLPSGIELSPEVEDGVYRVLREGLTNVIKHAPGAVVDVRLELNDEDLEIEVRDTGAVTLSPLAATGSGLGLAGMRSRIEPLGGRLEAGPEPGGGWSLRARLPLAGRALTPAG